VAYSQEGWRLEHETSTDNASQIVFKGVVYNEMKGAFVSSALFLDIYSTSLCELHFKHYKYITVETE